MSKLNKFIVFEGCEGVGKTYQVKRLVEYLEQTGQDYIVTREPGGTPEGEAVREILLSYPMPALTEAYLFCAARIAHIDKVIKPALAQGKIVICDRYIDSSIAYQGYARGLGRESVERINCYALENCMPDTVIFIDLPPDKAWNKKQNDRMEKEGEFFHADVYRGFKELEQSCSRFVTIIPDADKFKTIESIRRALTTRGVIE
ncbi:MAG: dTMP kinase [Christensenellales bacterium]|jgi:dTMP kinase